MTYIAGVLIVLAILYILSLKGRTSHPDINKLMNWRYTHRGLYDADAPENSIAAFRRAIENGYGIEFDVHLLADGQLAIIHDSPLERVTGKSGRIEDLTAKDLHNYYINGTTETIPLLSQLLAENRGRVPLIVELKTHGGNAAELTRAVCRQLEGYDGAYCLESFDSRCVYWLKKNRPDIVRGQLSGNFFKKFLKAPWYLRLPLTYMLLNFVIQPDFIAYYYPDRRNLSVILARKLWKIPGVSWTVHSQEELITAEKEGWTPIFDGFIPNS